MKTPLVLLVDDDENDIFIVHEAFAMAAPHVRVIATRDGREAISCLLNEPPFESTADFPMPDLVLTDLKMPVMNGFEFLRAVRGLAHLRHLIVCIYSASPRTEDVARAYELGANLYFNKPGRFQDLVSFAQALTNILPLLRSHPELGTG